MNIVRANSDRLTRSCPILSLTNLPPGLVEKATSRLCWIAVVNATTGVVMYFLQTVLQPEVAATQRQFLLRLTTLFVLSLSLSLGATRYFGWLSAKTILRLGLGYEVLIASVRSPASGHWGDWLGA